MAVQWKRGKLSGESDRLEQMIGGSLTRGLDRVTAAIGDDEFTRRQLRDAKFTSPAGLKRVARMLATLSPKPKNLRDLMARHTLDEVLELDGFGDWTIDALCEAFILQKINAGPWIHADVAEDEKISNARQRRLRAKQAKKSRPKRHRRRR